MTDFISTLGEYAEHPEIKDKIPDENPAQWLAKRVVDSQTEISRRLRVPGDDASTEDKAAFRDRVAKVLPNFVSIPEEGDADGWSALARQLGAPEKPDGYGEVDKGQEFLDALAPTAHALGLTKKQLTNLVGKLDDLRGDATKSDDQARAKAMEELDSEWGDAKPEKLMFARMYAAHNGMEGIFENNPLYGNNAPLVKVFAALGEKLAEREDVSTAVLQKSGILTLTEAQDRRAEIQRNADHPYNNATHADHDQAIEEMRSLNSYILRQQRRAG